jgi:hypothetical protein
MRHHQRNDYYNRRGYNGYYGGYGDWRRGY